MDLHRACNDFEQLAALAGIRVKVVGGKINPDGTIEFRFKTVKPALVEGPRWKIVGADDDN